MHSSRSLDRSPALRLIELSPVSSPTSPLTDRRPSYPHLTPLFHDSQNRKLLSSLRPTDQIRFLLPLNRITVWKQNELNRDKIRLCRSPKSKQSLRSLFVAPYSPTTLLNRQEVKKSSRKRQVTSRLLITTLELK